jgi:hypothetical protein
MDPPEPHTRDTRAASGNPIAVVDQVLRAVRGEAGAAGQGYERGTSPGRSGPEDAARRRPHLALLPAQHDLHRRDRTRVPPRAAPRNEGSGVRVPPSALKFSALENGLAGPAALPDVRPRGYGRTAAYEAQARNAARNPDGRRRQRRIDALGDKLCGAEPPASVRCATPCQSGSCVTVTATPPCLPPRSRSRYISSIGPPPRM